MAVDAGITLGAVTHDKRVWLSGHVPKPRWHLPKADTGPRHRCPLCRGQGVVPGITKVQGLGKGMGSDYGPCPECGGAGWIGANPDAV